MSITSYIYSAKRQTFVDIGNKYHHVEHMIGKVMKEFPDGVWIDEDQAYDMMGIIKEDDVLQYRVLNYNPDKYWSDVAINGRKEMDKQDRWMKPIDIKEWFDWHIAGTIKDIVRTLRKP